MGLGKVAVVASAKTLLRPAWRDAQHIDLISAVVTDVFRGTGLSIDDVDFVIDSGSDVLDGRSISNCGFLGALGAHHKEEARVEEDGLWAALYGVNKIRSGASRVGLIVAYSKPSESSVDAFWTAQCEPFYQRPVGFGQRAAHGLLAQRYLADHDIDADGLAEVVAARWQAARDYGGVQIDHLPDRAAVLGASEAASPLTELMMARPVDGAVAVLIANEPIANRAARRPVWVTGAGSAIERHAFASREAGTLASCAAAAKMARRNAGWDGTDPDLAEVSGPSVVGELMAIEALGLAKSGRGADAGKERLALNASGGALPADPIMATGLIRLADAVHQLSHPAAGSHAPAEPSRALVHGCGGVGMQNNCVFTLEV